MIFITTGSQEPFSRLINAISELSGSFPKLEFLVQDIGKGREDSNNICFKPFLLPGEFKTTIQKAKVIIAHAGIGSILSVLEVGKPLIVFPRLSRFGETRDDHQLDTARAFKKLGYLAVAETKEQLINELLQFNSNTSKIANPISDAASDELLISLKEFLNKK